jgi:hypothetical protein
MTMTRRPGLNECFDFAVLPARRDPAVTLLQEHNHLAELIFSDDGKAALHIVSRQHGGAAAQ